MQGINQLAGMAKFMQNPMAGMSQLTQNSSEMQQVQSYIQQNGGDARNACIKWAQDHGLDQSAVNQAYQTACQLFGNRFR